MVMSVTSITAVPAPRRIGTWVLQGAVAVAFFAAGAPKLAGTAYMVQLFDQIGFGSIGGLWLGATMVGALMTHLFILHTSPAAAIVLGVLNALIIYLRRDELAAYVPRIAPCA
jgi:putative oxidoreductase